MPNAKPTELEGGRVSLPATGRFTRPRSGLVRGLVHWIDAWLMGYDVFVSYAWLDGRAYAEKLVLGLKANGYRCFLDSSEYEAGSDLNRDARCAVRFSSSAAIVVTPAALRSHHVRREIRLFDALDKPLVPIDVNQTLYVRTVRDDGAEEWNQSQSASLILAESSEAERDAIRDVIGRICRGKRIQIVESQSAEPSRSTIEALCKRFRFSRRITRRLRVYAAVSVALALVTVIACFFWSEAIHERNLAESKTRAGRRWAGPLRRNWPSHRTSRSVHCCSQPRLLA